VCPAMVRVPAGTSTMGSPASDFDASQYEQPVHRVQLKSFEIGRYESYTGAPRDGSAWTSSGNCAERVARGGSWNYTRRFARSAERDRFDASLRFYDLGFRVARDVPRQSGARWPPQPMYC